MNKFIVIAIVAAFQLVCLTAGQSVSKNASDEYRLIRRLLSNYDRRARPIVNASHAVKVKIDLMPLQITRLDEQNQRARIEVWIKLLWNDPFLKWDPNEYNSIKLLSLNSQDVWVPDLYLYNSGGDFNHIKSSVNVLLESNGNVVYVIPTTVEPTFRFDLTYYPFDRQTCQVIIGSWTWHQEKVNLFYDNKEVVVDFLDSVAGEWKLDSVTVARNVKTYHTFENSYADIRYEFKLSRRWSFHVLNVYAPSVILALLSLIAAAMSPRSQLKVALAVFAFAALFGLNLYFAEKVSRFSQTQPFFGIYLFILTVLSFLVALVAGLAHTLASQDDKMAVNVLPGFIRRLLLNNQGQSFELSSADGQATAQASAPWSESAQLGAGLSKLAFWPLLLAFLAAFVGFLIVLPLMAP